MRKTAQITSTISFSRNRNRFHLDVDIKYVKSGISPQRERDERANKQSNDGEGYVNGWKNEKKKSVSQSVSQTYALTSE